MSKSFAADQGDSAKIQVVILEDGRYDRLGMIAELSAEPDIELVHATALPQELLAVISERHPAVAIIDLRIYDDDTVGLETIKKIRELTPDIRIIVLTAFPELGNFLSAFTLSVQAFVKKAAPDWRPGLGELIRSVVGGRQYYDPDLIQAMARQLNDIGRPAPANTNCGQELADVKISERELAVLRLLAANYTNQEIADRLVISINTVKAHIRNINEKLGSRGRHGAVIAAVARGLLNPPPSDPHHP